MLNGCEEKYPARAPSLWGGSKSEAAILAMSCDKVDSIRRNMYIVHEHSAIPRRCTKTNSNSQSGPVIRSDMPTSASS